MAPEMSVQTVDPMHARAAAVSPPGTPVTTAQSSQQQTTVPAGFEQQQQQGQFQPAYFQQYPRSYGQPVQSYPQAQPAHTQQLNQYQQQYQQQISQDLPRVAKGWMFARLALRIGNIIICICAIGLSFSLIGNGSAGYAFALCTPVFFAALIWDVAEIITWYARKRQTGIHPGAHVAVSLIIWLAAAIIGGIQSTFVAFSVYDYDTSEMCWDSDKQDYVDCEENDPYKSLRSKFLAVAVFSCFVWLVHFILFVAACVDTAKRNAALRRVVVVAPPYWGHAVQGWQPMPQYYAPTEQNMTGPPQSQQQNIPLQTRSPAPAESSVKGKEVDQGELSTQPGTQGGFVEYYTPSQR